MLDCTPAFVRGRWLAAESLRGYPNSRATKAWEVAGGHLLRINPNCTPLALARRYHAVYTSRPVRREAWGESLNPPGRL